MHQVNVAAFDLGASSGRVVVGRWDRAERRLSLEEMHRFPNEPVFVGGRLHWDILRIYNEMKQGFLKTRQAGIPLKSMAIDSWAVDFGIVDAAGELLGNPYHYRDRHTMGAMEEVASLIARETVFARTGIQFLPFNTIYQLHAMKKSASTVYERGHRLLMIPDLLRYFLTGEMKCEATNASTTQLYNPALRDWDPELLDALGLRRELFPPVVEAGAVAGFLAPSVCEEIGMESLPVIAVGEHDTASAVAAVPATEADFAYLSCGTWSLLGTELSKPVLSKQALDWNFTNEGGVKGTYHLLKNIMGLWLLQECRKQWEKDGRSYSFAELTVMAMQAEPLQSFVDPDHAMFLNPDRMADQIAAFCRETGQSVPQSDGQVARCILDSLALKYRLVLDRTERLTGKKFTGLHVVGGGVQNALLCQLTANAIGRPVWAGPVEASAIGNAIVQLMALGEIEGLRQARAIVKESFAMRTYLPCDLAQWEEANARFLGTIER